MGSDEETAEIERVLKARHDFALNYMEEKGWEIKTELLSLKQIMEIREQEGWKNP